jgi:hypothetical protein
MYGRPTKIQVTEHNNMKQKDIREVVTFGFYVRSSLTLCPPTLLLKDELGVVMGKSDTSGPPGTELWPLCMLISALLCDCTRPLNYLVPLIGVGHAVARLVEALP